MSLQAAPWSRVHHPDASRRHAVPVIPRRAKVVTRADAPATVMTAEISRRKNPAKKQRTEHFSHRLFSGAFRGMQHFASRCDSTDFLLLCSVNFLP